MTLSACGEIAALVQGLRHSAELPRVVSGSLEALRRAGVEFSHASVLLQSKDEGNLLCTLLPAPVSWERETVTSADVESLPAAVTTFAVGPDLVICRVAQGQLPQGFQDCANHLAALARRAHDLRTLEEAQSRLGYFDEGVIALHDGSLDLSGTDDQAVSRKVVSVVLERLGFDRAGVFLVDDENLRGCVGVDEVGRIVAIDRTVFPLHPEAAEDLTEGAQIARGDLPYFVTHDLDGEGRRSAEGDIEANVQVPMRVGGRIVGVLAADNYQSRRPILLEDIPRLMIVANQAAAAIINVRLQEALRHARDELEAEVGVRAVELASTNSQLRRAILTSREARAAEHRTLRRQQHLLASNPAVIYSCRVESGFPLTFVSDNVHNLIGWTASDVLADPELWISSIHPDDLSEFYDQTGLVVSTGQVSLEYRVRNRDGDWLWIQDEVRIVHTAHVDQPGRVEIMGSWLDITARRQAEANRQQALEQLEAQKSLAMRSDRLRSLGEMAAGIAHELNQPLAGVRGLSEHILLAISRDWALPRAKIQERVEKIVAQADRMIHIIDHVRVFAREAGRPEMSSMDVNDVVRAAMDMHGVQFRSRGIELTCRLQDDLPASWGNSYSLEEVVLNLLSNARDAIIERLEGAGEYSGGRVQLFTELTETGSILVSVVDNGVGLPVNDRERVFEPFFTSKGPDKGTGLGLSVSRSIVEQFDGRIWLEAALGGGMRAVVLLPAESDANTSRPQ